ncbi:pentapeptide repeat-containing protein [Dactylosporangium sp. NPDC049525]|uniref:pentapeptide repeat-containing protein n=1 Tax=Dactylosporangium sp. NPDC049525 TaxID=3154730 RepID=UPI0034339409
MREGVSLDLTTGEAGPTGPGEGAVEIAAEVLMRLVLQPPTAVPGAVRALHLIGAHVTGHLCMRYASIDVPVTIANCRFDQPVQLDGATVRAMDFTGSQFPALEADGLRIDGDLTLHHVNTGLVSLFGANVAGNLWLTGAHIDGPLRGPQLTVKGGIYAKSMNARGRVNLWGARAFTLELDHASLASDDGLALRTTGIQLEQNLEGSHLSITDGGVDLFGAKIGGQLRFEHAALRNANGWAVHAPMLTVGGNIYGRGLTADGGIDLAGASIGASIELPAATLTGQHRQALSAPAIRIGGRMSLDDRSRIAGAVTLSRSEINGTLSFATVEFTEDSTVDLRHAVVGKLDMTALSPPPAVLDLRNAAVGTIDDDPTAWPTHIRFAMCTYQTLHPMLPATERLTWLQRTADPYHPQPYEELANHYRRIGHDDEARTTAVARHQRRRNGLPPIRRFWGYIEDATIGYGYRANRALGWLTALTAAVTVVFAANPPQPAQPSGPPFQPVVYALDLILPVLDLRQERAFVPVGATQWVAWASTLTGWLLATTAIAGLTRRLTRP